MQTKYFSRQDLRGRSFRGQDLTYADFSYCDVHGVDFSGADLTNATFWQANMGKSCEIGWLIFQLPLGVIAGLIIAIGNFLIWKSIGMILEFFSINSGESQVIFMIAYSILFASMLFTVSVYQRWDYIMAWFLGLIIVGVTTRIDAVFILLITVVAIVIVTGIIAVTGAMIGIITGFVAMVIIASLFYIGGKNDAAPIDVASFIYIIMGLYLNWRANEKAEKQLLWLRNLSLKTACFRVTQFTFATLNGVDFSEADLSYAQFKNAKVINCNFHQAKNYHLASS